MHQRQRYFYLFTAFYTACLLLALPMDSRSGTLLAQSAITHQVQRGETLSSIAARYGVPVHSLVEVNRIQNPNNIRVGQRLQIPGYTRANQVVPPTTHAPQAVYVPPIQLPPTPVQTRIPPRNLPYVQSGCAAGRATDRHYTVRPGDTLSGIARTFGTTTALILQRNTLPSTMIRVGQCLIIPRVANVPGSMPTPPTPALDRRRYSEHPTATETPTIKVWPTAAPATPAPPRSE